MSEHCIPILHQIEQVSSDEHVGSLAEAVLEAIRGHPEVDVKVKYAVSLCQGKKMNYHCDKLNYNNHLINQTSLEFKWSKVVLLANGPFLNGV